MQVLNPPWTFRTLRSSKNIEENLLKIIQVYSNIYILTAILMYHMEQKCGYSKVREVFFVEPTNIHFIREISKKINLAPTSVRNHIQTLFKESFVLKKKSLPFDGYVSNRENEKFIFNKRVYNFSTLFDLKEKIIEELYPKAIVLFGSYFLGEDIETSDIDILVVSKINKEIEVKTFENKLQRKINVLVVDKLSKLDEGIQKKVKDGIVFHGSLNG